MCGRSTKTAGLAVLALALFLTAGCNGGSSSGNVSSGGTGGGPAVRVPSPQPAWLTEARREGLQ